MIVEKRKVEGATVLRVGGIVKLGESAEFLAETLRRALDQGEGNVLLDLEQINYIDSTGIGELVGYLTRFRSQDRQLILVKPSPRISKLLAVAQLDNLFPIYDSVDAALAAETGSPLAADEPPAGEGHQEEAQQADDGRAAG